MYVLGAATCGDALDDQRDARPHHDGGAVSGPGAFAMAGIKPADVDVLMGYDSFTITVLLHLEDLGFCAKGEGGAFVEDGKLGPGGCVPDEHERRRPLVHPPRASTACSCSSKRSASCAASAASGRSHDPKIAVAHGSGGVLSTMGTIVLGTEATR